MMLNSSFDIEVPGHRIYGGFMAEFFSSKIIADIEKISLCEAVKPTEVDYQEFLLEPCIIQSIKCNICLDIMMEPMVLSCGHSLCKSCLAGINNYSCPFCRHAIRSAVKNFSLFEIIEDLKIKCINGCEWKGTIANLNNHQEICDLTTCVCYWCKWSMEKKFLREHIVKECPYRRTNCDHCKEKISFTAKDKHQEKCEMRPVSCEKCQEKVAACNYHSHTLFHCVKRLIGCNYCYKRITYDEMDGHQKKYHADVVCKNCFKKFPVKLFIEHELKCATVSRKRNNFVKFKR